MSMSMFGLKVEEGKEGQNGQPSVGPVYRNPIAKNGFPPTDPDLSTAWQLFRAAVEKYPGNKMLGWRDFKDGKWGPYLWKTYKEAYVEILQTGSALRAHGIEPGARIGIYGSNCPQWIVAMQACSAHSLICVPLYDTLGPGAVDFIIEHAEIDIVFVQDKKVKELLNSECTHAKRLKLLVCFTSLQQEEKDKAVSMGIKPYSWNEFLNMGKENPLEPSPPQPLNICTIMYTSGTSGEPKGVILTHENMTASVTGVDHFMEEFEDKMTPDDVYISFLPLAHILDRMIEEFFFHRGASVGYYHGNINEIQEDLMELKPTFLAGVPRVYEKIHEGVLKALGELNPFRRSMFHILYNYKLKWMKLGYKQKYASPLADLLAFRKVKNRLGGRIRLIVSGGAPLGTEVEEFLRVTSCGFVLQGYGLTETCGLATIGHPDEMSMLGTVGPPFVFTEVRLEEVPEMGYDPLGDPSRGEICVSFNVMEFLNLVSWNTMIAWFQMRGQGDKAMGFFSVMHRYSLGFNRATLVSVLSSLFGMDEIDFSWGLQGCFQLHCVSVKTGFILDVGIVTALLKAYSILGGELRDCYKLFLEMSGSQDLVLWTEIIVAFSERDPTKAIILFGQLRREGLSLDSYAFSIALKACAGLVTDRNALMVHCEVIKSGFMDTVVLGNALIHAYARCGSISQAKQVFEEMRYRDIISWNSMLKAYALHGKANEALRLFRKMDVKPDATTFVSLLSACSHAGRVEEGIKIFDAMFEKHGIVPQLDHYACIVDIVGRAGHFFQAEKIIKEMPMLPDYVVWSAFLGACRKHRESGLAQIVASRLKELDPENSLAYVLMSNVHCSANSFNEAGHLRKQMRRLGVKKQPGLSWTEVGGLVHEFASGGLQHPDRKAIYTNLEDFVKELKHSGYIPETTSSLHDIEDEQKEEQLYYHSEKLALIYALQDASKSPSSCSAIKIIKNIRICLDCHNFMKLSSKLIEREIIVRDSNRFHHFKNGACSCNDYW